MFRFSFVPVNFWNQMLVCFIFSANETYFVVLIFLFKRTLLCVET